MKKKTGWVSWWWVNGGMWGPYVKTVFTTRRQTNRELQSYDIDNGWAVGRVHRQRVEMEPAPPANDEPRKD